MVCWFVGLWYVGLLFCWIVGCGLCRLPFFNCVGLRSYDLGFCCFVDFWFREFVFNVKTLMPEFIQNRLKNHPTLIHNPAKINQKRSQIDENASLERFRNQVEPMSASKRSP